MNLAKIIQLERKTGVPIYQQDNLVIRPVSRILTIWWRPYGGSVRNWPVAVEVEQNGIVREVPIFDVTLWARVVLGLMTVIFSLIIWMTGKRQSKHME